MKTVLFRLAAFTAIALLTGCANIGPPLPPSLELPKPPTDLRAVRKGDHVILTWTVPSLTTDKQTVRHLGATHICRSPDLEIAACGTPVGESPTTPPAAPAVKDKKAAKAQQTYADTLPRDLQQGHPQGLISYAVAVTNSDNHTAGLSNQVQVPAAPTLPPPPDFNAQVTAEGVVVRWTPVTAPSTPTDLGYLYHVHRHSEDGSVDAMAGEVPITSGQFLDHGFEWGKTYFYRVDVVTVVPQAGKPDLQVEGDDTEPVKVVADDVFPPATPIGLQAVFSGVGQQPFVDLVWTPDTEPDIAGYNVFRHEEGGTLVKMNTDLVKTPAFRDANVLSGHKYFYAVSARDLRGNESAKSEEANETVPQSSN